MVIKRNVIQEQGKDTFKEDNNNKNSEQIPNMSKISKCTVNSDVLWKCEPIKKNKGIEHIIKMFKITLGRLKKRKKES